MQLACCQFNVAWEDKAENYRRVDRLVAEARLAPGTLLLLPEMFATGFTMNAAAVAEPVDGPTARYVADLAARHGIFVQAGMVIRGETVRPRNEVLIFGPDGRLLTRYAKLHLFSFAGEQEHYQPGTTLTSFAWQAAQVAPSICYDLRFPELYRAATGLGAHVLTVIACWPAAREEHWRVLLRARAIENQCYVAAANRCGQDPSDLAYPGRSQIIDPWGEVLIEAGSGEGILQAAVDLSSQALYRQQFPALADRRATAAFRE